MNSTKIQLKSNSNEIRLKWKWEWNQIPLRGQLFAGGGTRAVHIALLLHYDTWNKWRDNLIKHSVEEEQKQQEQAEEERSEPCWCQRVTVVVTNTAAAKLLLRSCWSCSFRLEIDGTDDLLIFVAPESFRHSIIYWRLQRISLDLMNESIFNRVLQFYFSWQFSLSSIRTSLFMISVNLNLFLLWIHVS